MAIPWLAANAPALLEMWQPGTMGGPALADVLFGDAAPSGKLPASFPRCSGQLAYYNQRRTGRPPVDDDKYRSRYTDCKVGAEFPFGYGLTYTTFTLSDLQLDKPRLPRDGRAQASVTVANTGKRGGTEVVQLYVRDVASSVTRPIRELKGFQRVELGPGDSRRLTFALGPAELGFTGRDGKFAVEPGEFEIFAATSSVGGLKAKLLVE